MQVEEGGAGEARTAEEAVDLAVSLEEWLAETVPGMSSLLESPPIVQVAVILGVSLVLATLVSMVLRRFVARLFARTATELDDAILRAIGPPIYATMVAIGCRLALLRFGLTAGTATFLAALLSTVVALIWLVAVLRIASHVVDAMVRNHERFPLFHSDTGPLFDNLSKIMIVLVAAFIVLRIWGKDVTGLLTAGGIAGIAIGFAARDTLANLFAGLFIFADNPYRVGDFINLDSGERGQVTEIGIRSTRLLTRDDVEVTIPNSVMGGAKIVNESGGPHPKYRVRAPVGVAYGTDIDRVREILLEIAADEERICKSPKARVRMRAFGESSLDFELLGWVEAPVMRGQVIDALLVAIYKRFEVAEIEIPYAKRDLYIKEVPEAVPHVPP